MNWQGQKLAVNLRFEIFICLTCLLCLVFVGSDKARASVLHHEDWTFILLKEEDNVPDHGQFNMSLITFQNGDLADVGNFTCESTYSLEGTIIFHQQAKGQYWANFTYFDGPGASGPLSTTFIFHDLGYRFEKYPASLSTWNYDFEDNKKRYYKFFLTDHKPRQVGADGLILVQGTDLTDSLDVDYFHTQDNGTDLVFARIDNKTLWSSYELSDYGVSQYYSRLDGHIDGNSSGPGGWGSGFGGYLMYPEAFHLWGRREGTSIQIGVANWQGRAISGTPLVIRSQDRNSKTIQSTTNDSGTHTFELSQKSFPNLNFEINAVDVAYDEKFWYGEELFLVPLAPEVGQMVAGETFNVNFQVIYGGLPLEKGKVVNVFVIDSYQIIHHEVIAVEEGGMFELKFTPEAITWKNKQDVNARIEVNLIENSEVYSDTYGLPFHHHFNRNQSTKVSNLSITADENDGLVTLGNATKISVSIPAELSLDWSGVHSYNFANSPVELGLILPPGHDQWRPTWGKVSNGILWYQLWPKVGVQNVSISLPAFLNWEKVVLRLKVQLTPELGGLVYQDFSFPTKIVHEPMTHDQFLIEKGYAVEPDAYQNEEHEGPFLETPGFQIDNSHFSICIIVIAGIYSTIMPFKGKKRERRISSNRFKASTHAIENQMNLEKERRSKDLHYWKPNK